MDVHDLGEPGHVAAARRPAGGPVSGFRDRAVRLDRLAEEDDPIVERDPAEAGPAADRDLACVALHDVALRGAVGNEVVRASGDDVVAPAGPCGPWMPCGPCGPAGPAGPAGSWPALKSAARSEPFLRSLPVSVPLSRSAPLIDSFLTSVPVSEPFLTSLLPIVAAA
jgi:hypothetical protein